MKPFLYSDDTEPLSFVTGFGYCVVYNPLFLEMYILRSQTTRLWLMFLHSGLCKIVFTDPY